MNSCARVGRASLLWGSLFVASWALADSAQQIHLEIPNVRDDVGQIRASLYRDPASFRKEDQAIQVLTVPAKSGKLSLSFKGVPEGRYAVMVYHDANLDGKLNLRFGMFPTEGYGLSQNPKVMGPPKFEDSAFTVPSEDIQLPITLNY